ncbi:Ezrin/radixin/moesin family protein [Algivirga pacifica]|uniref:Ezrin/radixin/moesin family protein n=1 Tax=Algivirga pacifica TaxID=1162670 RepID=A0ABP9D7Q7_9BACT
MRKLFTVLLCLTFAFGAVSTSVYAQEKMSRKERKKWKKMKKGMSPEQFQALTAEKNTLQQEASALHQQVKTQEETITQLKAQVSEKDSQIGKLRNEMAELKEGQGDNFAKGVVYKVQIGAFKNRNLSKFQDKGNFWTEDQDGLKKYTIANFRDYEEADQFKKYIRAMGVKDAWIVAYEDNIRTDIQGALRSQGMDPEAIEQKKRTRP